MRKTIYTQKKTKIELLFNLIKKKYPRITISDQVLNQFLLEVTII